MEGIEDQRDPLGSATLLFLQLRCTIICCNNWCLGGQGAVGSGLLAPWQSPIFTGQFIIPTTDPTLTNLDNKAKAISAELLDLSLKNKLEETGKTR